MSSITILIVEDEPIVAEDLRDILTQFGYEVIGVAHRVEQALQKLALQQPDLLLLDVQLDGKLTGIDLAQRINTDYHIPFIFITSFSDQDTVAKVRETYPMGYLVKPFNEQSLFTTLEIALHNFARFQAEKDLAISQNELNHKLSMPLTDREFATLQLLRRGLTNPQIAAKQFVSVNTVKTHLSNLFVKLGVDSRTQAVLRVHSLLVR